MLDQETRNSWIKKIDYSLPEFLSITTKNSSHDVFLIGAAVFDIYQSQGWIKGFSRQTGDADFSIEYLGDPSEYREISRILKEKNYKLDDRHPYRYHPPKKQGIYAYVDLLTFTVDKNQERDAKRVMGVGDQFYFEGMAFAKIAPLKFVDNIYIPNPLALIYLKLKSYYNSPERKKDLVDMVELILRIVHEDEILNDLKQIIEGNEDAQVREDLRRMCRDIAEDRGGAFDLDDASDDINERLLDDYSHNDIRNHVEFFARAVLS